MEEINKIEPHRGILLTPPPHPQLWETLLLRMAALTEQSLNELNNLRKLNWTDLVAIIIELQNKMDSLNHELTAEMKQMKISFEDEMK